MAAASGKPAGAGKRPAPKVSSLLAARIRADIISRELHVGTELPIEAELVKREGLSRASVREALRILEHEGLISLRRGLGGGAFVARPDPRHISMSLAALLSVSHARMRDLFEFRRLVEPEAARLTALRRTEEEASDLERLSKESTAEAEVAFHRVIAKASGNVVLEVLLHAFIDMLGSFQVGTHVLEDDMRTASKAHVRISAAVRDRDGDRAAAAMAVHVDAWERRLEAMGHLDAPAIPPSRWRGVP